MESIKNMIKRTKFKINLPGQTKPIMPKDSKVQIPSAKYAGLPKGKQAGLPKGKYVYPKNVM